MGMSRAFGYSKKQAGVIYRAWKTGKIHAEKATIDAMYRIAEDGFDESLETIQKRILGGAITSACSSIMEGLTTLAQRDFDTFAKYANAKTQAEWDARAGFAAAAR